MIHILCYFSGLTVVDVQYVLVYGGFYTFLHITHAQSGLRILSGAEEGPL